MFLKWLITSLVVILEAILCIRFWKKKESLLYHLLFVVALAGEWYALQKIALLVIYSVPWVLESGWRGAVYDLAWGVPAYGGLVLLSFAAGFFAYFLWRLFIWLKEKELFQNLFGTTPPKNSDEVVIMQETVGKKLEWMAFSLHALYEAENTLLSEASGDFETVELKRGELDEMRKSVARAKKRFWQAHNIAARYKFAVFPSFKDYVEAYKRNKEVGESRMKTLPNLPKNRRPSKRGDR
jgi:hypothetical protein